MFKTLFKKIRYHTLVRKYPWIYKNNVVVDNVRLDHKDKIELGGNCYVGAGCEFYADAGLKIGKTTIFWA